ncbi:molybdate transport system substrate-binding protein [Monaibacterium marinum]|uniref:Molybdate transport system substrate-binding protein n=1 Tax=Pontivivens marinum TaxID=1690039 RepID=A0A2C9CTP2_9RHOB|nr:molybdate ABC transporter substrate-binding protein [Monaibacterium marinum]SOH94598.1 molybdate transport system substrate-binding protein [Monaibacterium marinum]
MSFRHAAIIIVASTIALLTAGESRSESVRILAAASMTEVIEALSDGFSDANPDIQISTVLAGSGLLARQVQQGVPADIYISANPEWVRWLQDRDFGLSSQVIASNSLIWVSLNADPAQQAIAQQQRIALADPDSVPAGSYARQSLQSMGFWLDIEGRVILATNVRDALGWVVRGHAPVGITYATDAIAYPQLFTDPIAAETHDPIRYEALVLSPAGTDFADYLRSTDAQAILASFGFLPPL